MTPLDAGDADVPSIAVALTGAGGGFARTFLAQLSRMQGVRPAVLLDLDLLALGTMLDELGYDRSSWIVCARPEQVRAAAAAGITALVSDASLCLAETFDVLVEATGNVRAGHALARAALDASRPVVMVSKEVESVAGVFLADLAARRGVSYLPGRGDQPANLLALLEEIDALGLEVVAIGKSGEYDLVFTPVRGEARLLDEVVAAPGLNDLLDLGSDVRATLAARERAVAGLTRAAAADYCEMAVVSQYTGFLPDIETMHYPIARPGELADIYSLREHGGLLERDGVVDVFTMLRLPGEASFAGGEFVVVRTHDRETWRMLRQKGHVVSADGRYACVYHPYHLMGVETPLSVLAAVGGASSRLPRQHSMLLGRAERPLAPGTPLRVAGHHHEIDGVAPVLIPGGAELPGAVPFYLLDGTRLRRAVQEGELIGIDDVDGHDRELWEAFRLGRVLGTTTSGGRA